MAITMSISPMAFSISLPNVCNTSTSNKHTTILNVLHYFKIENQIFKNPKNLLKFKSIKKSNTVFCFCISYLQLAPHKFGTTGILAGGLFDGDKKNDFCTPYVNSTYYCCANPYDATVNFNGRINTHVCNQVF